MQFVILFSVLLHCLKMKMILIFHTLMQGKESLLWPRYCFLQGPFPILGNRCGSRRRGTLGEGRGGGPCVWQLWKALCSTHLFLIIHLCLSACILHRGAWCWHYSSAWNIPLHVWRNDSKSNLFCRMKIRGKSVCQIHTLSHTNRRGERWAMVFMGLTKQVKVCEIVVSV